MTVLEIGPGPGFFTTEISKLLNGTGKIIAADLQEAMLLKVKNKLEREKLTNIQLHKTEEDHINLNEEVDFILIFYMLHEVPNKKGFLEELKGLLNKNGKILFSEPKLHVKKENFEKSVKLLQSLGFKIVEKPNIFFSRSVLMEI
jgi:ubiquinone/menaquinone biosynthesis C-methylase UbiE